MDVGDMLQDCGERSTNWLFIFWGWQPRGDLDPGVGLWPLHPYPTPSLLPSGAKRGLRDPAQAGPQWIKDLEALPGWPGNQQPAMPECEAGSLEAGV